jgi:hypothetical protein
MDNMLPPTERDQRNPRAGDQRAEDRLASQFRGQLQEAQALYDAQPVLVKRFVESEAALLADAIVQRLAQVRFNLPDRIFVPIGRITKPAAVPQQQRSQMAGRLRDRLSRSDLLTALHERLQELEHTQDPAVAGAASLLRYATGMHMVYNMLPSGRTVTYTAQEIDDIPNVPITASTDVESAITQASDAIVEETREENGRGQLQVPFVPAARHFFLPQWVAFDEEGNLLVNSANQAEANLASMQNYLYILKSAQYLCPYIIADAEYQQKRYGIVGQVVNQGRALAIYEVREIINTIQSRAEAGDLNRGLSLDLPYFSDQTMAVENWPMEIIPKGRIMFVPAFVVRAARIEQSKVQQEGRLSQSTRRHLLSLLRTLEASFEPAGEKSRK